MPGHDARAYRITIYRITYSGDVSIGNDFAHGVLFDESYDSSGQFLTSGESPGVSLRRSNYSRLPERGLLPTFLTE